MIIQTAAPVAPIPPMSSYKVDVTIDLVQHVINVIVTAPGVPPMVDSRPLPASLQTNLETYAQGRAELLLGVTPGSTTIQQP